MEKAQAYKMKLEALKRQGKRSDLTSRQVVGKLEAADVIVYIPMHLSMLHGVLVHSFRSSGAYHPVN